MLRPPGPSGRVLVAAASVNDERALTSWIAKDVGFEVVRVTRDGDEAIRLALDLRPDLIVANVNLEGASGIEVAERLWAKMPTAGCVLVADAASWGAHRKAMRAGALDFLQPPLGPDEAETMRAALRQVLRRRALLAEDDGRAARPDRYEARARGTVVSVIAAKGGMGRSFVAANLAAALHTLATTVLVDLDLQFGDVSTWGPEGVPPRTLDQLAAVVRAGELRSEDVAAVAVPRFGGLPVLAAPRDPLSAAAWSVCYSDACPLAVHPDPAKHERTHPGARLVDAIRQWYEWTVVDNMPGLFDPVIDVTRASDLAIVVTTCEVGALIATRRYLGLLDGLLRLPRLIVANRYDRGEDRGSIAAALGPDEQIVFIEEDREFGRGLVIDGLAAPQRTGHRIARTFIGLADQLAETAPVAEGS